MDAGRREHGNKSRVEGRRIFDPALSSIFSVRLYLRIPLQEAHGVPYLSQKFYSHNPSALVLMVAMVGTKQLPTSSTQYPSFIFVPDTVLKVGRYSTSRGGPCWKQRSYSPAVKYSTHF